MIPGPEEQKRLKKMLAELDALPDGWDIVVTASDRHLVTYSKDGGETATAVHPHWGPLPKGWSLRLFRIVKGEPMHPRYENKRNMKQYVANPRLRSEVIKAHEDKVRKVHEEKDSSFSSIAGSMRKSLPGDNISDFGRAPISDEDLSDHYEYLHCLDGVVGDKGIGGMNGGVFVVRLRETGVLYVEKRYCHTSELHKQLVKLANPDRFKKEDRKYAKAEIKLLRRLKHSALNFYIAAHITPDKCAVWLEFCDQGSLKDITRAYKAKRKQADRAGIEKPHMPEKWLWHCYIGLCDALAYLQTGLNFASDKIQDPKAKAPGWVPVLHRDIKLDNIFLKSRANSGARKYFYCVLSDFGMAVEEFPPGDPRAKESPNYRNHVLGGHCGTGHWLAPELCTPDWDPGETFPNGKGHTAKSDLWAIGTIIYDMAECDDAAHVNWDRYDEAPLEIAVKDEKTGEPMKDPDTGEPVMEDYTYHGFCRKMQKLRRNIKGYYSDELRECVLQGASPHPEKRPTVQQLLVKMLNMSKKMAEPTPEDMLPAWASRKHEYHSKEAKTAEQLIAGE